MAAPSPRRRARLGALATLIASVLVALLLAEGVVRLFLPPSGPNPALVSMEGDTDEGPWTGWRLAPNQQTTHQGVEVRTNAWGCRDAEFDPSALAGKRRILVTGDSFVYGEGTAQELTLPYALRAAYAGPYEVLGCGQWGHNTLDSYMLYRAHLAKLDPAIVLHVFVPNDAECRLFCTQEVTPPPTGGRSQIAWERWKGTFDPWLGSRSRLWQLTTTVVERSLQGDAFQQSLLKSFAPESPGWTQGRRYVLQYRDLAQANGGRFVVAIFPFMADFQHYPFAAVHRTIRDFCTEHGLTCIDLLPAFEAAGGSPGSYHANLLNQHPNAEAFAIAARHITRVLPSP